MADARRLSPGGDSTVSLWISLTVEGDYRNRAAFPGLRIDSAIKRSGTTLLFRVPVDFAHEVLEDAKNRRKEIGGGRGLYQAYRALTKNLQALVDRADGVQADPGSDTWEAGIRSLGCIAVNTVVRDEDNDALVIVSPYKRYRVFSNDGEFKDNDTGKRFSYMYGYGVKKVEGGENFFQAAGQLYDADGCFTHLRLVRDNGRPVA